MRIFHLTLYLIVSLISSVSAQQVIVSGSDYTGVNGTYTLTSSGSGYIIYEKDGDPSYYFDGTDYGNNFWYWGLYVPVWAPGGSCFYGYGSSSDPTTFSWGGGYDYYANYSYIPPTISFPTPTVTTASAASSASPHQTLRVWHRRKRTCLDPLRYALSGRRPCATADRLRLSQVSASAVLLALLSQREVSPTQV